MSEVFKKKLNSAPLLANVFYEDLAIKMNKVVNILDIGKWNAKLDSLRNLNENKKAK